MRLELVLKYKGEVNMSQNGPSSRRKFFSKRHEDKVEEEILSMVEEGYEQGIIEDSEAEMISNIFEFSEKDARDIMTNRQKIIGIENDMVVKDALSFAIENNFSRYPVFEEDIDNIIGVVHIKDMIAAYMIDQDTSITKVMEEPFFIHPTYNISKLLQEMQKKMLHMSIIVDEYGQTEGLVTMEDIIEEIVGNILDEHDEGVEEEIKCIGKDSYIVSGGASLDDISELIDIELPEEDLETVNGFMLYKLGRLPSSGDEIIQIEHDGYRFTPKEICDKMITIVQIDKIEENIIEDKE